MFQQSLFKVFRKNETLLHPLNYLFWECTLRCNLNCLHCGSDCKASQSSNDMPFEDFLKAVIPLKNKYPAENIMIVFTGGEPLMREDIARCGMELRKNGFRWGMVTNGYVYDQSLHSQLVSAGIGAITLSLDGLEDNHNWLRGNPHAFDNALTALDLINAYPRINSDVVSCINSRNISELPDIYDLLLSHKTKAWRLFTIAPIGRAAINKDLQLNGDQLKYLMDFICQCRKGSKMDVKFSCEAYTGKYEKKVRDSFFFCRAGINIASILNDGSVSACPNINHSFIQGNIYNDNFIDIWESRFLEMRDRAWMKTGSCKQCKRYELCQGGAMHLRKDMLSPTMNCIYQKIKRND